MATGNGHCRWLIDSIHRLLRSDRLQIVTSISPGGHCTCSLPD
ncbi:hypothetical protein [Leptolyngbya sp. FACHB-671]|nr:hypothetical protein [Leptolyngbya sp. FACHB-671]